MQQEVGLCSETNTRRKKFTVSLASHSTAPSLSFPTTSCLSQPTAVHHLCLSTQAWFLHVLSKSHTLQACFLLANDPRSSRASLVAQLVKNLPAMRETWVQSLGWEDSLEKGKATHSSILAWRIPWTAQTMGLQRVGHD